MPDAQPDSPERASPGLPSAGMWFRQGLQEGPRNADLPARPGRAKLALAARRDLTGVRRRFNGADANGLISKV